MDMSAEPADSGDEQLIRQLVVRAQSVELKLTEEGVPEAARDGGIRT